MLVHRSALIDITNYNGQVSRIDASSYIENKHWEHLMHGFSGDAPPHTSSLPPLEAQIAKQPRRVHSISPVK